MDFDHVGAQCAKSRCAQRDFLPFVCLRCGLAFCLEHRQPGSHDCAAAAATAAATPGVGAPILPHASSASSALPLQRCCALQCGATPSALTLFLACRDCG